MAVLIKQTPQMASVGGEQGLICVEATSHAEEVLLNQ
jgi:hypothetical protein